MIRLATILALSGTPALAATGPFFSLRNTDFIVLLAFLLFVGILLYYKVPAALGGMLDKRAEGIRADLAEARRLRDEAQEIYASYERRQREVRGQARDLPPVQLPRSALLQGEEDHERDPHDREAAEHGEENAQPLRHRVPPPCECPAKRN